VTFGATAPVDYLGLVDLEARVIHGGQARRGTDRTVDIHHPAAVPADEVVMIIAGPPLVTRRRPGGLDATDETLVGQDAQSVVHRLTGDDADLGAHDLGGFVRRTVRSARHRRQNGQTLSRDLDTVSTKKIGRVVVHDDRMIQILEFVKIREMSNFFRDDGAERFFVFRPLMTRASVNE